MLCFFVICFEFWVRFWAKKKMCLRSGRTWKAASNAFSRICRIEPKHETVVKKQGSETKKTSCTLTKNSKKMTFGEDRHLERILSVFLLFWSLSGVPFSIEIVSEAMSSHRDSEGNLVRKHPPKNTMKNFSISSLPDFKEFILAQILAKLDCAFQNEYIWYFFSLWAVFLYPTSDQNSCIGSRQ